jgi:hypothetical protein
MKNQTQAMMEEKLAFLFQPDTLLPAQYFNRLRRASSLEPEKTLMLAVLEDAINCFKDNLSAESVNKKLLFDEAEEWILDTSTDWVFSFENICEAFELNPQYVRQALLRWKQEHIPTRSSASIWQESQING